MSKMNPAPHAPVAEPMPEPMVMTPRMAPREEIGGLGGDGGAARAPREAEEAGVQPEEPALARTRDAERADHAHDGDAVGKDGRALAPDVIRDRAREDGA